MTTLFMPKGRWQWTHQVPFEDRPEEIPISYNRRYTSSIRTAQIYQESITYVRKVWPRGQQWDGFTREVALHKTQLRPIHGALVPALIGIHTNYDGVQMTYDIPHHSFWIQASPDMPDVLKRRCLEAYHQLHAQGVLHGSVELSNILIGGDGRVKIFNFDQSRSAKANPQVHLDHATPNDFKMEMREVHYKLDYMKARQKERTAWKNKDNPQGTQLPMGDSSRIHSRPPYTVSLEPPTDPSQWSIPDFWRPKRFVVPGQSVKQFEYHLRQFFLRLDEEEGEGIDPPKFKSKKRKRDNRDSDSSDESPPSKRVRFLALTRHDDGTTREVTSPPPPGVKRIVPRISRAYKDIRYPFDPDEGEVGTSSSGYASAAPFPFSYPYIAPLFDHQEFLSSWNSCRSRRQMLQDIDDAENDVRPSERVLGKRRVVDDSDNIDSMPDDTPHPKRLRRSETTFLGESDAGPSSSSSSRDSPSVSPRYFTRSSLRTQANVENVSGTSGTSSSRSSPARGSSNSAYPTPRRAGDSTSRSRTSPETPVAPSSRTRVVAGVLRAPGTSLTPDSIDRSSQARSSDSRISSRRRSTGSTLVSHHNSTATRTGAQDASQLASAVAAVSGGRPSGSHSEFFRDTFVPVLMFYDPVTDSFTDSPPSRPRSTIDTVRLVAEQLPGTILTAANMIARSFGLW
ncbi:hypothetical protein AN958_04855 [Leucoagaricus sp. SymC.cos]|nr:hypothetical protein AN958_04855 [Leucoagaricus sp. SymC.cos]